TRKPYTIVIPPPNITGALHMGHALNNVLQDIFIRYYKLKGFNACWIPGTDHGGIATQNVIEKQLRERGLDRHQVGREKFLEIMWQWRYQTGDTILMQLRKLGCLCDWDRTRFTMDHICAEAVFASFKKLFEEGLIYRGTYMVNWCPRCNTALSDIEVEHEEKNGNLWYIKYPLKDDPKEGIIVATTRPETMLGDTAVAVNPNDEQYKKYIGKSINLPLMNRQIPIVADEMVEKEFGTGAVKITPSHDPNDYELAKRHNLPHVVVIDKIGVMTDEAGKYQGLDRYKCRKQVLEDLESEGLLVKTESYKNNVSVCYRCNTTIEPLISDQWYLKTKEMANMGMKAVEDGRVKFEPANWKKPYLAWLENLHDWCISRQIWWGHRIPIWYCTSCHEEGSKKGIVVSKEKPQTCPDCNASEFMQDEDVLDTWFSSSLWPFSTLKWPEENKELDYFYPTNTLVTGHEILYLWVARMIMMGLHLKHDIPFDTVYIHGIVRDAHGKKMSKSLGNVIDPLGTIDEYGTDALRFSLTSQGIMGRDLHVSDDNFAASRNFCNKLWNASRFMLLNLDKFIKENNFLFDEDIESMIASEKELELSDKWILNLFQELIDEVTGYYEAHDFANAARSLYGFVWNKYCDWYLELVKSRLYSDNFESKKKAFLILAYILDQSLHLLHPIIPHITDEISSMLSGLLKTNRKTLLESIWSKSNKKFKNTESNPSMQKVIDIVSSIRNIKGEMRIPNSKKVKLYLKGEKLNDTAKGYVENMLKSEEIINAKDLKKPDFSAAAVIDGYEIFIPLKDLIDIDKEKAKLNKEFSKLEIQKN
ncbi:valine--tRNA ligase, partial [bacterium]